MISRTHIRLLVRTAVWPFSFLLYSGHWHGRGVEKTCPNYLPPIVGSGVRMRWEHIWASHSVSLYHPRSSCRRGGRLDPTCANVRRDDTSPVHNYILDGNTISLSAAIFCYSSNSVQLRSFSGMTRGDWFNVPSAGLALIAGTQNWGFSYCKVQRRPPADNFLNESLPPKTPPADTMFMAAMAMVLPWKIVEDFKSFVKKNTKLWPSL